MAKKKAKHVKTPLHEAIERGDYEEVKQLITSGADLHAREKGRTPLHRAACCGHTEIVKLLIDEGANVNAKDGHGWRALDYASEKGRKEVVELLRKHGAKE